MVAPAISPLSTGHPFPSLTVKPTSGLTFPWTFYNPNVVSTMDAAFGPDGVVMAEQMLIRFQDVGDALRQLLGYSWRDTSGSASAQPGTGVLRRKLPWQHPYCNQMVLKNISSVKGISQSGAMGADVSSDQSTINAPPFLGEGSFGSGYTRNTGPWNTFQFLLLTLHFWRPPYFVRSDSDILIPDPWNPGAMYQAEFLRYVDKDWDSASEILTREGNAYTWSTGQGQSVTGIPAAGSTGIPGAVGQTVFKNRVMRRWYELPEEAIFTASSDAALNGPPLNLIYTTHAVQNPITGYTYPGRSYQGSGLTGGTTSVGQNPGNINNGPLYPGSYISNCVNITMGGGTVGGSPPPYRIDDVSWPGLNRLWGCYVGTLLFLIPKIKPRPLQMPAELMQIVTFGNGEPISQQQYDVELHFVLFDPPRDTANLPNEFRGHNLYPYAGNTFWYAMQSQKQVGSSFMTAMQYADLSDLFRIL